MIAIKKYLITPLRYTILTGICIFIYSLFASTFTVSHLLQTLLLPTLFYLLLFALGFLVLLLFTWISTSPAAGVGSGNWVSKLNSQGAVRTRAFMDGISRQHGASKVLRGNELSRSQLPIQPLQRLRAAAGDHRRARKVDRRQLCR